METESACLNIQNLCRLLETETDETRRRILARRGEDYCRTLAMSLKSEKELSNLTIKELGHRLKNKAATIQSIIAYQLREHEAARTRIMHRLGALSSTDALIDASDGEGALITDIINAELVPYELSRSTVEGPEILLSPKLAMALALIFHELATNAAKHGGLSTPSGRISLWWAMTATSLTLEWRESGGPKVASPIHAGFGTRLLSRALEPFGGAVDMDFAASGLICKVSVGCHSDLSVVSAKGVAHGMCSGTT